MAFRCSDAQTIETIARVYTDYHQIIDPHTAVGISTLEQSGLMDKNICVALACAHPAKFPDVVKRAIGITPALPPHMADLMQRPEKYQVMANDFSVLRKNLMNV
jgi:threonine synthase